MNEVEDGRRRSSGSASMIAAPSSDGVSWLRRAMSSADRKDSNSAPVLGTEFAQASMASLPLRLDEGVERRVTFSLGEFRENLREIGRMLFLQQVQQIGHRAHAQQAPHGLENEVDFALGCSHRRPICHGCCGLRRRTGVWP